MSLPTLSQAAAWVTLVLLLSALLYGAGRLLEWMGRGVVPMRTIWGGVLLALLGLAVAAPLRVPTGVAVPGTGRGPAVAAATASAAPTSSRLGALMEGFRVALTLGAAPLSAAARGAQEVAASVPAPVARRAMPWLLGAWGAASVGVLLVLLAGYRRLLRRIAQGTPQALQGVPVVVTDAIGPLVAGVRAPRIVVPQWLLARPADEQALVLAHEQAHLAARDPLLLVAGAAGTVLMPWNPFSWALLARLRLAIEVDCDQRVLRLGASTGRYGRLLIDLAAAAPRLPLSAPAFSYHTTHLERRLRTMTTPAPRHRGARRLSFLATAALALVTACESQLPTAAEVERMDVAALEARTAAAMPTVADGPVRFFMNGREITEAEAKALPAGKIATIVITKSDKAREVRISTEGYPMKVVQGVGVFAQQLDSGAVSGATLVGVRIDSAGSAGMTGRGDSAVVRIVRRDGAPTVVAGRPFTVDLRGRAGGDTSTVVVVGNASATLTGAAQPLLIVDGVRMAQDALKRLAPDAIASIEVIKGPAASKVYGPDGANGVIVVTTKGKK